MYSPAKESYHCARAFGYPSEPNVGLGLHLAITQGVFESPIHVSGSRARKLGTDKFMPDAHPLSSRPIRSELLDQSQIAIILSDFPFKERALTWDLRGANLTGILHSNHSPETRFGIETILKMVGSNTDFIGQLAIADPTTAHQILHTLTLTSLALYGGRYWASHIQRGDFSFIRIQQPVETGDNGLNIIGVPDLNSDQHIHSTHLRKDALGPVDWQNGLPHTPHIPATLVEHIEMNRTPTNFVEYIYYMSKDALTASTTNLPFTAAKYPIDQLITGNYNPQYAIHSAVNWLLAFVHNPQKTRKIEKALGLDSVFGHQNLPGHMLDLLITSDEQVFNQPNNKSIYDKWRFATLQSPDLAKLLSYYLVVPVEELISKLHATSTDIVSGQLSQLLSYSNEAAIQSQCQRGVNAIELLLTTPRHTPLSDSTIACLRITQDNLNNFKLH